MLVNTIHRGEDIIMKSNSGKSNLSGDRRAYEFVTDSCDHLTTTSLRDLSLKYKELGREQADSIDLTKKNITCKSQEPTEKSVLSDDT